MRAAFDGGEDVKSKPGEKEWQQFVSMLDKDLAADFKKIRFLLYKDNRVLLEVKNFDQSEMIEKHFHDVAVLNHTKKCAIKVFGKPINISYKILKE